MLQGDQDRAQPKLINAQTEQFLKTVADQAIRVERALEILQSIDVSIENYCAKAREGVLDAATMAEVRIELQDSLDHYLH